MISKEDVDGNLVAAQRNQLYLATTLFDCGKCSEPIEFARFTHHAHNYLWGTGSRCDALHRFHESRLTFNESTSEQARRIITKGGLNPETATVKDMDSLGAWFRCQACKVKSDGSFEVMNWRSLICLDIMS